MDEISNIFSIVWVHSSTKHASAVTLERRLKPCHEIAIPKVIIILNVNPVNSTIVQAHL